MARTTRGPRTSCDRDRRLAGRVLTVDAQIATRTFDCRRWGCSNAASSEYGPQSVKDYEEAWKAKGYGL